MLETLREVERILPDLLRDDLSSWKSLDVDYEPPRVERLWRPHGDFRVYLHRIHPCEKALLHPHPWPSAVRVVSGRYEMGIGAHMRQEKEWSWPDVQVEEVIRTVLEAGSSYEMVHPGGWHYVRPLEAPSLSLMVTGRPYQEQLYDHSGFGKDANLGPLGGADQESLLKEFREHYHYWR